MLDSPIYRLITILLCALLFVVCDTLAANWGKNGSTSSLVAVIFLAPFSYLLFGYLNQHYPLSVVSAWVVVILCICTVLIGIFYFKDPLTTRQMVGLALAIVAISLLGS
jgi:multidrug transporter EmrE-like cation transporter